MNVKKYLQQQAEQDRKTIVSENDDRFLQNVKAEIDTKTSPSPRHFARLRFWLIGTTSVLASIAILVCVLVFYPQGQGVIYYENNFVQSDSTLQSMDEDMKEFAFDIDEKLYTVKVQVTTDSVSGDTIMYYADITSHDKLLKLSIIAVCNKNYHYRGLQITEEYSTEKLPLYEIRYTSTIIPDPDFGFNIFNAKAQIQRGSEFIYITEYTETMLGDQPMFYDNIQSLIK